MTIFRDLFKLSKKLSKALLENKGLQDLEASDLFSDDAKTHIKQHLSSEAIKENLEQFKGIELDKNFGIYEITFASDLTIKSVTEISGFGNPIDQKLTGIIKQTEWTSNDNGINDKIPNNSKLIIGI